MDYAASYGHLDIVKWLHENRTEGCTEQAMNLAASYGHLDIIIYLHTNRTEGCTFRAIDYAAAHGHLEVVKFLYENRKEGCTVDAMNYANNKGHLDILKFLCGHYKHLVTKVNEKVYEKLLPIIQEDFRSLFTRIEKENIVREFIAKKLVYHPSSSYIKRIVGRF
jgi:phage tail protein X